VSVLNRSNCLANFWTLGHLQKNSSGTLNTKILENFISFLTMGRTLDSDIEQRNYDWLKLNDIIRYDFLIFKFNFEFLSVLTFIDRMVCFS
jgi:hypothetical protein